VSNTTTDLSSVYSERTKLKLRS